MGNFPKADIETSGEPLATGMQLDYEAFQRLEHSHRTYGYMHPFTVKLIEHGVIPHGCHTFTIGVPVDGLMTITATYFVDKESFERAIRETYTSAKSAKYAKQNAKYAAKVAAHVKTVAALARAKRKR